MQNIIDETEKRAYVFLKEFGFDESEVIPVVMKGMFELENAFNDLKILLEKCDVCDAEKMDDHLHAIKGLLFQLGNHKLAEEIEILRQYKDIETLCQKLEELIFEK